MFRRYRNPTTHGTERLPFAMWPPPVVRFKGVDPRHPLSQQLRLRYAGVILGVMRSTYQNADLAGLSQVSKMFTYPWGRVRYMRQQQQEYIDIDLHDSMDVRRVAAAVRDIYDRLFAGLFSISVSCTGITYDATQEAATGNYAGLQWWGEAESTLSATLTIGDTVLAATATSNNARSVALDIYVFESDGFFEIDKLIPVAFAPDEPAPGPVQPPYDGDQRNSWFRWLGRDQITDVFGEARAATVVDDVTYTGPPVAPPAFPLEWSATSASVRRSVLTTATAIGINPVLSDVVASASGTMSGQVVTPGTFPAYTVNDQWQQGASSSCQWGVQNLEFFERKATTWRGASSESERRYAAKPFRVSFIADSLTASGTSITGSCTYPLAYTNYTRQQLLAAGATLNTLTFTVSRPFG